MASNSTPEYKIIADQIGSSDEDIIIKVAGDMYKGSISPSNKYVTASEAGGEAAIADFVFDTDSNGEPGDGESTMTVHNHDMTIRTTRDDAPEGSEGPYDADIDINSADDVWINAHDQIEITADNAEIDITAVTDAVYITAGGHRGEDGDTWEFNTDGSLTFPDNTVQTTAYTGGSGTDLGNFTFEDSTAKVSDGDMILEANEGDGAVAAQIKVGAGDVPIDIAAYEEDEDSFYEGDWSTAEWQSDGNGGGQIVLTGATNVLDFLDASFDGEFQKININNDFLYPYTGGSYGGGNATLYVTTGPDGGTPVTITSLMFRWSNKSGITIDLDDSEMEINAPNMDIRLNAGDDIAFSADSSSPGSPDWRMNSNGNFDLPNNGYISNPGSSSGDGNNNATIKIVPDSNLDSDQYIIIDPTEPNHIHVRAGGTMDASGADLIIGAENTHVAVSEGYETVILKGGNGQFLNYSDSDNQIATMGDIANIYSGELSFEVIGGTLGDQPTFEGDPLFTGSYVQQGAMIHFRIDVDMDNITSFGTGQYYVDLPFPAKYNYLFRNACLHDVSMPRQYGLSGHVEAGQSRMLLFYTDTSGQDYAFDYNSPALLTVNDNFHISGDYILGQSL